jgi:hypothetical protein
MAVPVDIGNGYAASVVCRQLGRPVRREPLRGSPVNVGNRGRTGKQWGADLLGSACRRLLSRSEAGPAGNKRLLVCISPESVKRPGRGIQNPSRLRST